MNFAQMLMQDVKPQPPTRKNPVKGKPNRDPKNAQRARRVQAIERYKAGLADWIGTRAFEDKVGLSHATAFKTLHTYLKLGMVERRPKSGEFNRNYGWQWKWK
jgi:hypothetical protein